MQVRFLLEQLWYGHGIDLRRDEEMIRHAGLLDLFLYAEAEKGVTFSTAMKAACRIAFEYDIAVKVKWNKVYYEVNPILMIERLQESLDARTNEIA